MVKIIATVYHETTFPCLSIKPANLRIWTISCHVPYFVFGQQAPQLIASIEYYVLLANGCVQFLLLSAWGSPGSEVRECMY